MGEKRELQKRRERERECERAKATDSCEKIKIQKNSKRGEKIGGYK